MAHKYVSKMEFSYEKAHQDINSKLHAYQPNSVISETKYSFLGHNTMEDCNCDGTHTYACVVCDFAYLIWP